MIKYKLLIDFILVTLFYFLLYWAKMGLGKRLENHARIRCVCKRATGLS